MFGKRRLARILELLDMGPSTARRQALIEAQLEIGKHQRIVNSDLRRLAKVEPGTDEAQRIVDELEDAWKALDEWKHFVNQVRAGKVESGPAKNYIAGERGKPRSGTDHTQRSAQPSVDGQTSPRRNRSSGESDGDAATDATDRKRRTYDFAEGSDLKSSAQGRGSKSAHEEAAEAGEFEATAERLSAEFGGVDTRTLLDAGSATSGATKGPVQVSTGPHIVPAEWREFKASHNEEFGQRLRKFRNSDDTSSKKSLRGGEGQVFLSDEHPNLALKRWRESRLGDMDESVRRLRGAEAAVNADPQISEHIRVVHTHEIGSDWILRDFAPDSRKIRSLKHDSEVMSKHAAVMKLALHSSPDEFLRMLGPKIKKFGGNAHWSPSEKKFIIIDMQ